MTSKASALEAVMVENLLAINLSISSFFLSVKLICMYICVYSAGVDGGFDEKLLLFVSGQVDGLGDESVDFVIGVVAGELDVGLVVLFEKSGWEVAQTERDL